MLTEPVGEHASKWLKSQRSGRRLGTKPHWEEAADRSAMNGPRKRTNVWSPVPKPIEDRTPRISHQEV